MGALSSSVQVLTNSGRREALKARRRSAAAFSAAALSFASPSRNAAKRSQETKPPALASSQKHASARRPARRIAERSFNETPTTRGAGESAAFIASPRDSARKFEGPTFDAAAAPGAPNTG